MSKLLAALIVCAAVALLFLDVSFRREPTSASSAVLFPVHVSVR